MKKYFYSFRIKVGTYTRGWTITNAEFAMKPILIIILFLL